VSNTTTPASMARILRALVLGQVLSERSRSTLTGWLIGCRTGADRLRSGLPTGWVIGDKTGNNGEDAFGDISVAWPRANVPIVICAYTRGGSPTSEQVKAAFAAIGRYVGSILA
jgi:beta-lactamase class A